LRASAQTPDTARVSLGEMPIELESPPVDSVVAALADSLFVPPEGRSRIIRDRYGVPHIYGSTDADVAFGFGYAQSEDHLLPMLILYRQASGRLAEIWGRDYIESDHMALLWRTHAVAGERYGSIPRPTREVIEGFAEGVNHYIRVHRHSLPDWVAEISPVDLVALSRWRHYLFAESTGRPELETKGIKTAMSTLAGGNLWAVGSGRSATGRPMLVMDPHLPWESPFQWYEAHLSSADGWNCSGATFFGSPVIYMGHNARLAWSMVVNSADIWDLYEERLDVANSRRYVYGEEKLRMTSRRVRIKVAGGEGKPAYEVERELLYTIHGPVYKRMEDWAYAARTSMEDVVGTIGQLYAMNRAQDHPTFRRALAMLELPMFNVMYADVDGNTYYAYSARCPVRSEAYDWGAAVPGWLPETEWKGILDYTRLPQLLNPTSGFLQNCNTAAHLVTVESGLDPEAFPAYLGRSGFNDRGLRLLNWLASHSDVTIDDMKQLARDDYLIAAEEAKGTILRAYNRRWAEIYDPEGHVANAVRVLRDWDNRATLDSRGTLLFSVWRERFEPLYDQLPPGQRQDVTALEKLSLEALRTTVEYMVAAYGRMDVPWREVNLMRRGGRAEPVSGSPPGAPALHRIYSRLSENGEIHVTGGSSFTMVVSLEDTIQAWSALPYGNSEDPESPHYADQMVLQTRDAFKPAWFRDTDVFMNLESVTTVPLPDADADLSALRDMWRMRRSRDAEGAAGDSLRTTEAAGPGD
jgi:acyl-homoserine-lactone acylase